MAGFRQLALEFVLADDEAKRTSIAQQAASEIQNGAASMNPVACWVEAVQPWMPGGNSDDVAGDINDDTPDWTGRAKALDFLSRTLDFLSTDALKPSQVKLLVGFFGAMFDIDHKAGIMPSATALSRIVAMKAFQPTMADDIIQKVCTLKDDFSRQISATRLAIFELLRSLITTPEVASALQHKYGAPSGFITDLINLFRVERDPSCLMVWFDILAYFMREYDPSPEILEEVFATFKAYFPISLPRASQSGITSDELKLQLRKCFTSNRQLANRSFDFLIKKMDQGEGLTVNVKVDILKTMKACLETYDDPDQSVAPHVDQIWTSLKYEVRNGEVEDTIWATLEVLKTIAMRLKDDKLRDYCLAVTRDCVNDLSNVLYTAPAGRLLISVLSATPASFVLMVSPVITHVKENLRHPKTPSHSQDLLKLLHVILETRLLLVGANMTAQERSDFAAIDPSFQSLYDDVYKKPVELGARPGVSEDDLKLSAQAVQGAGALVCQQTCTYTSENTESGATSGRLLPSEKCSEICNVLLSIIAETVTENIHGQSAASNELVNDTTKALQRAITSYPSGLAPLVKKTIGTVRDTWSRGGPVSVVQTLCSLLAFIGCSELPSSPVDGLSGFLLMTKAIYIELVASIDAKADFSVRCALVAGLQATVRCFNDACKKQNTSTDEISWGPEWVSAITTKYPILEQADISGGIGGESTAAGSVSDIYSDFLLASLYFARALYRKATNETQSHPETGQRSLELSSEFKSANEPVISQYLHLVSALAGFIFHEMSEAQQLCLDASTYALHLFRDDFISATQGVKVGENGSSWDWLTTERVNILSFGILDALRPASITKLFSLGVAQDLLISGVSVHHSFADSPTASVSRSILTILANKYKIETVEPIMRAIDLASEQIIQHPEATGALDKATSLFSVAAGMVRRYSGKQAQGVLQLLRAAPGLPSIGQNLARRMEMVVAPQRILGKENYAIVKPLWMQKMYIELAKPLIPKALGRDPDVTDRVVRTNYSIGVLLVVKHLSYSIYEEDAEDILRIAITVAQTIGRGPDASAALDGVRNILSESPEKGEPHLSSIISICIGAFSRTPQMTTPDWLPSDYVPATPGSSNAESSAASGRVALDIMAGLPKMVASHHLQPLAAQVERELTLACGNAVRELRKSARAARATWRDLR